MRFGNEKTLDIFPRDRKRFMGFVNEPYFIGEYFSGIKDDKKVIIEDINESNIWSTMTQKFKLDTEEARLMHFLVRFREGLKEKQVIGLKNSINDYCSARNIDVGFHYFSR